jgi:hypothetical protein
VQPRKTTFLYSQKQATRTNNSNKNLLTQQIFLKPIIPLRMCKLVYVASKVVMMFSIGMSIADSTTNLGLQGPEHTYHLQHLRWG